MHCESTRHGRSGGKRWLLLVPRMSLVRPARGGLVPKDKLQERFARFPAGQWASLIDGSIAAADLTSQVATGSDDVLKTTRSDEQTEQRH